VTPKKRCKISVSELRNIARSLDALPPHRDTSVSKQKAIALLAPELHAMRSKGYSWSDIATLLTNNGVPVSAVALQSYLWRARVADETERPASRRKRRARVAHDSATASPAVLSAPVRVGTTTSLEPPVAPASAERLLERPTEELRRRSMFVVRSDSDEI
jgi:hypothetical protein